MVEKLTGQPEKPKSSDTYAAIRWSAASKYGAMLVQFAVSLLLARLLAPEYFGLLGMATVVTGFAKTLKSLGFNAVIIQRKDMDHALLSTLFWGNLAFCSLVTILLILASPIASWIYQDSRVAPLVAVLALNIFLNSFCTVPSSLLVRKLEFKKLAVREIGGVVASAIVGVSFALADFGVWALVFSTTASSLTIVVMLNVVEPFWPSLTLDRTRLKECLKFGLNITGYNIFSFFSKNADNLIIGVFLGPLALGYYSLAYRFMRLLRDSVSRLISRVLFPKLSELQDDDNKLAKAFLRTVCGVALFTFPAAIGLALLAGPLVEAFLGTKWMPAVPAISSLAIVGAIQSLTVLSGPIYLAKQRADWMFRWGIVVSIAYVLAFLLGVNWELNGVAWCYMVANVILVVPEFMIPFKLVDGLTMRRLLMALAPFVFATIVMTVVLAPISFFVNRSIGPEYGLGISMAVGAFTYITTMMFLRPPAVDDYLMLVFGSKFKKKVPDVMASTSSTVLTEKA